MQILGLLDMHFEAVVVKVKTFLLLFRLALAILWQNYSKGSFFQKILYATLVLFISSNFGGK